MSDAVQPVKISLVINTLNEEANIVACIRSVGSFADEIVVVDMYSDDKTRELAEKLGARVILHKRESYVEKARRFAMDQARGEWIFLIDADERATPPLLDELQNWMAYPNVNVVHLRMSYLFMGKFLRYGSYSAAPLLRFFRRRYYLKGAPADEDATIHSGQPRGLLEIPGQVIAKERFLHFASPTLDKYVRKMVQYYSIYEARDRFNKKGVRPKLGRLIFWPLKAFIGSYFYHMGFLDGLQGFILSVVWAFTRFLVSAHLYDLEAGRKDDDPWIGMVTFPENYGKSVEEQLNRLDL